MSTSIVDKYKRYLETIFEINDPAYANQFKKELSQEATLAKGPFIDVTDSFQKGRDITSLISEGLLSKGFSKLKTNRNRPLYKHQEEALLKVKEGKNIVVSTGTGSGKTESFLFPIFDYLLRQHEANKLGAGVRALLIYPMNALANDQIERLRELLQDYPELTYGSYTGQTKPKYNEALAEYKMLNNDQTPPVNELISREQMKAKPPHILITNYAMLEYLMIRPEDNVFFDGGFSENWKFIVLDEAHVYNGSTGIEVSMLLRRLKAKLCKDDLQYVLTSATLGQENDNEEVAQFATQLCDSPFRKDDIIRAKRVKLEAGEDLLRLPIDFYNQIAGELNEQYEDSEILSKITSNYDDLSKESLEEALYELILKDLNYWEIRRLISTPRTVFEIAQQMNWSQTDVENFVMVASRGEKNNDRLFDARYHMFLRATESVFITLQPSKKLFLTRKPVHYEGNEEYKVFEIATCSSCHEIYLVGQQMNHYLEQASVVDEEGIRAIFLLGSSISDSDEDHLLEDENIKAEEYQLCSRCGYLMKSATINGPTCDHDKKYYVTVFRVNIDTTSKTLTKCLSCENTNNHGILRMFFTGQEAATSVIGTALFEELPSYEMKVEITKEDDDFGFGLGEVHEEITKTNVAKQFLAFSDSRQAAAFYSSYLDQTYRNILYKRLIVETLNDKAYLTKGKAFPDFIEDLVYQFETKGIAIRSSDQTHKEAWKAALHELVDNNGNTSLFSMGLFELSLNDENILPNAMLHLTAQDVATLCNVMAMGIMADAALEYQANLNKADKEYFTHSGVEYSYTLSDSDKLSYTRSFIPTKASMTNKRLDYLSRVLKKAGNDLSDEKVRVILEKGIWRIFTSQGFLKVRNGKYKLDVEKITISRNKQWYICPKCKKVTIHNSFGVCPTFKCEGELQSVDLREAYANNHYYRMYQDLDIRELRVVEHTAQLNKETAYEYQKKFKQKEIDVLSCSTTFEMGVDVGSLETVFMRNMPPSPSNYAQRAGRAGRSKHSAAYALTFCNKSSHDFSFFKTPEKMIKGRIQPPKFNVENEKIAIRHLYASALSFFWRKYPEYFSIASKMTEKMESGRTGVEVFTEYLNGHPLDLGNYLERFLPDSLIRKFGVPHYEWIPGLLSDGQENEGVLTKAVLEYEYEVNILNEAIDRAIAENRRIDHLRERVKVYRNEEILSFLSRKNVLPKYGFPVDTVEMTILDHSNRTKLGLQLQRDLSMAISEYAPGSQIVANGNLITSRYIRKIPNMSWKQFDYIQCECNTLNIEQHIEEDEYSTLEQCKQCGKPFQAASRKVFLIPQFGFEADGDNIKKPGLKKPMRTFRNEIAYIGYKNEIETTQLQLGEASFELRMSQADEMAVLNESNFFVCEQCGYTVLDDKDFNKTKRQKHKTPSGYWCRNDGKNRLKKFALGYRFKTDVVQLRFINPDLNDYEVGLSVLHGVLRGMCRYLNIEDSDISGCLHYFYNSHTNRPNFSLVLFDKTPGGAGHVRRLNTERALEGVLMETLNLMQQCDCGGEEKDSSCYTCLRGYYNQKHHDRLKRRYVIDFIQEILGKTWRGYREEGIRIEAR
ncbi:DEAD/DEAH box helicase [Desulfitobacterium sp. THU1]|uniref:DEAD/DEAH box helicase n=1 Tax=Desulfitobacterium sp. THU1 TaxID=3138072 RepID=UPI00311E8DF6